MADRVPGVAVIRGRLRRIEAANLSLPLRPESIDVAVKQEEQRISCGGLNAGDGTTEAGMRRSMRVAFQGPERCVLITKGQSLRLGAETRRRRRCVEEGSAINPLNAVGSPELQGLVALNWTVPIESETPTNSRVKMFGAGWSKRQ